MSKQPDCDFYYFKPQGKWKYEGKGVFPTAKNLGMSEGVYVDVNHSTIFKANGEMPGIIGEGKHLTVVVIPMLHCKAEFAYPRMIRAEYEPEYLRQPTL